MANATTVSLRKLRNTDLAFINYFEDIRGETVVDSTGRVVGEVDALFIDDRDRKIRFFRVKADRQFTTSGATILMPVDAVTRVTHGVVYIDRPREQLPVRPPDLSPLADESDVEMRYHEYGFQPFWTPGYMYPPYPFYMCRNDPRGRHDQVQPREPSGATRRWLG